MTQEQTPAPQMFDATLTRGANYTLLVPNPENPKAPKELAFTRGEPKAVTADVKAILERSAVDSVTITVGEERSVEERQKFTFAPASDGSDKGPAKRTRAAA